ncbi:MAG: hypothetical protein GXP32_07620 [Kiritimatiellaeota bacterium]|nr:hypothetical protein [Kiritimatiellota bacterium]
MKEVNVSWALSQASLSEVGGVLLDHMRSVVKESLVSPTLEEAALSRGGEVDLAGCKVNRDRLLTRQLNI